MAKGAGGGGRTGGRGGGNVARAVAAMERGIAGQNFETGVVLDSNGNVVLRKDGDASSIHFVADEITKMYGQTFTHNHPKGSSFSADDVIMASYANVNF